VRIINPAKAAELEAKEAELRVEVELKLAELTSRQPAEEATKLKAAAEAERASAAAAAKAKAAGTPPAASAAQDAPRAPRNFEEAFQIVKDAILGEATEDLRGMLEEGLQRMRDSPPLKCISAVLGREVSLSEVRKMLFMPDESSMRMYPRMIRGAAKAHQRQEDQLAEVKASTPFLSLLFLYHSRNPDAAKAFVHAGGLLALPDIFCAENLYLRGQAIEIMQNFTHEDLINWFQDPSEVKHDELPTLSLHRQLLGLMRTKFIPNLVVNSKPPPGADSVGGAVGLTSMCLRLLAFWLSWVRHFFCKDFGALMLSQQLLDTIKEWGGDDAGEEEKQLRSNLYEDFIRFGVSESEGPWGNGIVCTVECPTGVKERGNDCLKAGRILCAVSHYSMALDLSPGDASLYANRAAAMLKFAGSSQVSANERQQHLEQVMQDCNQAISIQPDYTKAHYRKGQALVALDDYKGAFEVLTNGLKACPGDDALDKLLGEVINKLPAEERPIEEIEEEEPEEDEVDLLDVE